MKKKMQITLASETMEALQTAAAEKGITPGTLARMVLRERFAQPDAKSKSYAFTVTNWQEVEEYVEAKRLSSVEVLAGFAMEQYMTKYPLTGGQKRQIEKNIENTDMPR